MQTKICLLGVQYQIEPSNSREYFIFISFLLDYGMAKGNKLEIVQISMLQANIKSFLFKVGTGTYLCTYIILR